MNPDLVVKWLLASLALGVLLLGGAGAYSAYVASSNHHSSCTRVDLLADEFENVIALALTPQPGKTYTAAQFAQVDTFEAKSAALLDRARC